MQKTKQKVPRFLYCTWRRLRFTLHSSALAPALPSSFSLLKWHPPLYKMIGWDFKDVAIAHGTGCMQLIM
jgi:hypothetical protein